MGVSGSGAVMAYPSGELSGTNAVYARIELAKVLPAVLSAPDFSQQVSVFSDWGMAGQAQAVDSNDKQRHINDVGLGYSVN